MFSGPQTEGLEEEFRGRLKGVGSPAPWDPPYPLEPWPVGRFCQGSPAPHLSWRASWEAR